MSRAAARHHVLVIDDEPQCLATSEELLKLHGFAVTTCAVPTEVLPLLKANAYDVVLLDIRMPGLDGTDLLPLIKRLRPEVPVILVSAYCDAADANYYRALGAFGAISKPFSHELLVDTIARAIGQEEEIPVVLRGFSMRSARDQVYRKLILAALQRVRWNQVKAAELLGVSRYCLIRWVKKLGIAC